MMCKYIPKFETAEKRWGPKRSLGQAPGSGLESVERRGQVLNQCISMEILG